MSLDIDFTDVFTQAASIINSIWPIFVIPLGIVFGFGILSKIVAEIKRAVAGH